MGCGSSYDKLEPSTVETTLNGTTVTKIYRNGKLVHHQVHQNNTSANSNDLKMGPDGSVVMKMDGMSISVGPKGVSMKMD